MSRRSRQQKLARSTRPALLRAAGLSETDIAKIKNGQVPKDFEVHHKQPLDVEGGDNSFGNLMLVGKRPYHKAITNEHRPLFGKEEGAAITVDMPDFDTDVFFYNGSLI